MWPLKWTIPTRPAEGSLYESAEDIREHDRQPRRRDLRADLQGRGSPDGARAQARARDGREQDGLGLARVRAKRVLGMALTARSRTLRRGRAGGDRRAVRISARARAGREPCAQLV